MLQPSRHPRMTRDFQTCRDAAVQRVKVYSSVQPCPWPHVLSSAHPQHLLVLQAPRTVLYRQAFKTGVRLYLLCVYVCSVTQTLAMPLHLPTAHAVWAGGPGATGCAACPMRVCARVPLRCPHSDAFLRTFPVVSGAGGSGLRFLTTGELKTPCPAFVCHGRIFSAEGPARVLSPLFTRWFS